MPQSSTVSRRDLWTARMQRFRDSQLTAKEFCRREEVSEASFYLWKRKLAQASAAVPKFLPVTTGRVSEVSTLTLPGGASIELNAHLTRAELTDIFAAAIVATRAIKQAEDRS